MRLRYFLRSCVFINPSAQRKAKPVYRYFDGWKEDISNIRKFEDLPENCQKYVRFIEEYTGTTVSLVSVSPERSGNIILKELL